MTAHPRSPRTAQRSRAAPTAAEGCAAALAESPTQEASSARPSECIPGACAAGGARGDRQCLLAVLWERGGRWGADAGGRGPVGAGHRAALHHAALLRGAPALLQHQAGVPVGGRGGAGRQAGERFADAIACIACESRGCRAASAADRVPCFSLRTCPSLGLQRAAAAATAPYSVCCERDECSLPLLVCL